MRRLPILAGSISNTNVPAQNDSFTLHNIKTYQYVEGQAGQSDAEKLAADMAAVTETAILGGQSKDSVTANLTLPESPMANGER